LINEWVEERSKVGSAQYVWHKEQLDAVDVDNTDYLLGLFEATHCLYRINIHASNVGHREPLLTDMVHKSLQMLQKEENGFFLLVESGRVGSRSNWCYEVFHYQFKF
jgi:alkaline phosphatase